ncbi:MAG TPA: glycosyltransferase family 9 protein [Polyangiaceae bacterium]|nr:glycosyltransferase family 9 protein [Polyangiaceae bacterium]
MALYEVPDGEFLLAREALDRALGDDPAEVFVHLGLSSLRRATWALPAIDAALERFGQADFIWSARPVVRSLLEGHFEARRRPKRAPAPAPKGRRVELSLDDGPADVPSAADQPDAPSAVGRPGAPSAVGRPGAPSAAGLRGDEEAFVLRVRPVYRVGDGIHVASRWARGATNAGLARANERPALNLPAPARRQAQALAHALAGRWSRPLIAFLPARRSHRRWGAEAMGAFARMLGERLGARAFVWPPEPIEGCLAPSASLPPTTAAALLSLCTLCVGDDDGWAHVAAAVGAPTLTVHGPTCPVRSGPASALGAALGAPPCRSTEHARPLGRRCLRCLEPAKVVELAEELASERRPRDIVARWR